jgi:hypothetical protein
MLSAFVGSGERNAVPFRGGRVKEKLRDPHVESQVVDHNLPSGLYSDVLRSDISE